MAELGSEPRACFTYYAIVSQLMQTVTSQTQRNPCAHTPTQRPCGSLALWDPGRVGLGDYEAAGVVSVCLTPWLTLGFGSTLGPRLSPLWQTPQL